MTNKSNISYDITNYENNKANVIADFITIEEPLETIVRYKKDNKLYDESIYITMRTPSNDEDLVIGFLFSEAIIDSYENIKEIKFIGNKVGKYKLKNKVRVTLDDNHKFDKENIERYFLTNSSCGVCGKTSIKALNMIYKPKIDKNYPKVDKKLITKLPEILYNSQVQFVKTGGNHASALVTNEGEVIVIREDVGRHNALDKLIGYSIKNLILNTNLQFIICSGRLSFELVQKSLRANIAMLVGIGSPSSLAIDLADKFDMSLIGFVNSKKFNIYSGKNRII